MFAIHARGTEWEQPVPALQGTTELQQHAQPALLHSVILAAALVVPVIHVLKMPSLMVVIASARLGITNLAQLALLATRPIYLRRVTLQEGIQDAKLTHLSRTEYAPATTDTIT